MLTLSSTETGNIAQICGLAEFPAKAGKLTAGRPVRDVEVRIVDADGESLPAGQVGRIAIRSRWLTSGYWGQPELTAKSLRKVGGSDKMEFLSGDLGMLDGEGLLWHCGRADEVVKIRGFRIDLAEVERAMLSLGGILEAAACAHPLPTGEKSLVLYYVTKAGATNGSPRDDLAKLLPPVMLPNHLIRVPQRKV